MNLKYPRKPMWERELDDLLNCERGLSGDEISFIDDLDYRRRYKGRFVTPSQRERIKKIWDRIFSR